MRKLVVVGGGGHGRELLELVGAVNAAHRRYDLLGVLDDAVPDAGLLAAFGTRHLGPVQMMRELDAEYVIGVGSPDARAAIDRAASGWGRDPATLVHPRAVVGGGVVLGPGSVVCALASITTNVRTGRHTHLNIAATVAHDCRLGDYTTLAPGARLSGAVTLGDRVTVGTGAVVIQGLAIGAGAIVGAGAVVVRNLPAEVVAVGIPARPRSPAVDPAGVV